MKMQRPVLLTFLLLLSAQAVRATVPVCEQTPSFVTEKPIDAFDATRLPERVFVARSVEVWAENKSRGMMLLGHHNFKSMKADVHCSTPLQDGALNLTALVPTLLDRTQTKTWGDSLWQMQILSEAKRAGLWTQKSRLLSSDQARVIMQKGTWRFIDANTYELISEQGDKENRIVLRIVYDVMSP
jgi:hypothetical protein